MKVNIDEMGPWYFNNELKSKIELNGVSGEIIADADPNHIGWWSKDLLVLHIPTGKVNGYSTYYDLQRKQPLLTIFNGWFQEPLQHPLSEFKYIYK